MITRFVAAAFAVALIAGCAPLVSGPDAGMAQQSQHVQQPDASAAAKYCRSTGGQVQKRIPVSGTDDSSSKQELVLAGSAQFCMYAKKNSRIYVLVSTLYATKPTLAALAYYKAPKVPKSCNAGDPASCYCTYVGGSDRFNDVGVAEGAWVLEGAADVDLDACIFPDLSSIDSWGLTYHADNVVSGIDLAKVLRYRPKH
ncbi:MAG TPA: hypothetical protein VGG89_05545 [Candidatus Baltobacteraceae bacterium]|jgi:putative hemolysin